MQAVFGFISSYKIWGMVPLDLTMHLFVGAIWTLIGVFQESSLKTVFLGLVIIAGTKEACDYIFHLPSPFSEYLYDFLISFVFIGILWLTRRTKKKLDEADAPVKKWDIY